MPVYTAVYASLLAILYIALSINVIRIRRKERIALFDGGNDQLKRAIRVHGNFAEYIPLALILLGSFEWGGGSRLLVNLLGIGLVAGRLLHAYGVLYEEPRSHSYNGRARGMALTLTAMAILALGNIFHAIF